MSFERRDFRDALGRFATGVALVTARAQDQRPIGITINSFSSVSLDPPLVLWSLASTSPNLEHFGVGSEHLIHILAHDQEELARRFASRMEFKFEGLQHGESPKGLPRFDDCLAYFDCTTHAWHTEGDHVIVIARVHGLDHRARDPLLFCGGKFAVLGSPASNAG
jgi:3-hydroxy-9,10-secoandrosta-1,3,5(10)-triene-9,17-dione monooxygenase reductase component